MRRRRRISFAWAGARPRNAGPARRRARSTASCGRRRRSASRSAPPQVTAARRSGGTALSVALWAALLARIGQAMAETGDTPLGLVAPALYRLVQPGLFNVPAMGGNETTGRVGGYFARLGWDACTGLGTPNGAALLDAILRDADQGPGPHAAAEVALDWTWLPGLAREVAEGRDGTLWALGTVETPSQRQLFRATPCGWTAVSEAFG